MWARSRLTQSGLGLPIYRAKEGTEIEKAWTTHGVSTFSHLTYLKSDRKDWDFFLLVPSIFEILCNLKKKKQYTGRRKMAEKRCIVVVFCLFFLLLLKEIHFRTPMPTPTHTSLAQRRALTWHSTIPNGKKVELY